MPNPIYEKDGKWWHWDEAAFFSYGPFSSLTQAERALEDYCNYLEWGDGLRKEAKDMKLVARVLAIGKKGASPLLGDDVKVGDLFEITKMYESSSSNFGRSFELHNGMVMAVERGSAHLDGGSWEILNLKEED